MDYLHCRFQGVSKTNHTTYHSSLCERFLPYDIFTTFKPFLQLCQTTSMSRPSQAGIQSLKMQKLFSPAHTLFHMAKTLAMTRPVPERAWFRYFRRGYRPNAREHYRTG